MDLETLTLRGIRSYVSEQTVDFRGKSLVGVVGNTGAGKSTLLEAIVFGLYGQSSWADRGTGKYISLISDGEQAMKVEIVFGHDGERWKVTRTGNRSGTANARLENLGTGRTFNGVGEVTAQVSRILGMKLDAFLSVVLLAQGEFDRLLNAPSAKRPQLLKEVLGTEALSDARQQADKHYDSINDLLGEAQRQRE